MSKRGEIKYAIKTSNKSVRKYPNVIWFPRSKTDPREIREVLKLALHTQKENPEGFFNDKLLGEKMAQIGSINVVGLDGGKYIDSYDGKSIGDVSYITNARMLMRLFRFLGFVTRKSKGKYALTDLGKIYCSFTGDFPDYKNETSEENILLESLANFAFYSVNDDPSYRDAKFKIRPFVWLLYTLSIEPQCIYQLIVTAFATKLETDQEKDRIVGILKNLREGTTDLKKEWEKLGLNADDYSCVHNFYDSVKILVYLGISLGLIDKTSNPTYGKKIAGRGRHLKQATVFYTLTDKGSDFVKKYLDRKVLFYEDIYKAFGDTQTLKATILLACLNYRISTTKVEKISKNFFDESFDIEKIIEIYKKSLGIDVVSSNGYLVLKSPVSFSFYQSVPPEFLQEDILQKYYNKLMNEINNDDLVTSTTTKHSKTERLAEFAPYFELDKKRQYSASGTSSELENSIQYSGKEEVFGGQDRFSSRVSPTNTVIVEKDVMYVDNSKDALDLLVPLRLSDPVLTEFIRNNTIDLLEVFMKRSDMWEKDQHYTWVRNCFRHFGMEALYSGSGGMLSRADVSVISPFIGGIEAKSPRENRGTLNTKSIRQAVDAKIQVADQYDSTLPRTAIAVGRRISTQAIQEEKKWAKENQPILLLHDAVLYYFVLKSRLIDFSEKSLIEFFTENNGPMTTEMLMKFFSSNTSNKEDLNTTEKELREIAHYLAVDTNSD